MITLRAIILSDGRACEITTDHAASSYGVPVVVVAGVPHGPADLVGETLSTAPLGEDDAAAADLVGRARAAGFVVVC